MTVKAVSQRGLFLRSLISVLTIIVFWEAVARAGLAPALFLPPFTTVIAAWWTVSADGSLPLDLAVSLSRAAIACVVVVAFLADRLLLALTEKSLRWHESARGR